MPACAPVPPNDAWNELTSPAPNGSEKVKTKVCGESAGPPVPGPVPKAGLVRAGATACETMKASKVGFELPATA